jgi:23S rRNA pseudouridine2457 synthase
MVDLDAEGSEVLYDFDEKDLRPHPVRFSSLIYWAQVERVPTDEALAALRRGVDLGDLVTRPADARLIDEPAGLWPRDPPIRFRAKVPTAWLELTLREGKNRQVRRMTAKVGFPTLRLVRSSIGRVALDGLPPGTWREVSAKDL